MLLAGAVAVALVAASASQARTSSRAAGAVPPQGGIVWAVPADVTGTDPENNGQDLSQSILSLVYQHLVTLTDGVHIGPQLAVRWTHPNAKTYIFHLRRNVHFSNGRLMTAADVTGSFHRILSKAEGSYLAGRLTAVKAVKALNNSTVEFVLKTPFAGFLAALADPAAAIIPVKELQKGTFDPDKQLLGTGPFMVKSHQLNESWTLVPNPHYWAPGQPKVAQLKITVIPDESTMIAALRSGTADVAIFQSAGAKSLLASVPSVTSVVQTGTEYFALLLNDVSGPLTNRTLRQAISEGLDRQKLVSIGLSGVGRPVGPAPGTPTSCNVSALKYEKFDQAAATAAVKAAGAAGTKLTLQYDTSYPDFANIAQVIASELGKIGLDVSLQPLPNGQDIKNIVDGGFQMSMTFYGTGTDPYFGLIDWNPALSGFTSKYNAPVPAINALLPKIARTSAPTVRKRLIQQACRLIDEDAAQVSLVSKAQTVAYRSDLLAANVRPVEDASNPLRGIETWTVKKK